MYGQPWYSGYGYPSNYSPYSSYRNPYQAPAAFNGGYDDDDVEMQERARALAERRARRAQYLPDEDDDDDDVDNWGYNQFGPRQRAYLEAKRRQQMEERRQEEAAREQARRELLERKRAEQEELVRRQTLARQERQRALEKRYREEEEARQKMVAERKRQLRLKREEEARRHAEEEAKNKQEGTSIPVHSQRPSSPSKASTQPPRSRSTTPQPRVPTPPPKHTPEELNEAASKIQNRYRIHSSFKVLDDTAAQFVALKKGFVYPRAIDFQKPGAESGNITVGAYRAPSDFDNDDEARTQVDGPEGKLDYTSTNYPLHAYSEALNKLLIKLDGVESWGKKAIRDKRKTIVKSIEKEASKLDRYCKQAWIDYLANYVEESKPQAEVIPSQTEEDEPSEPQPASSSMDVSEPVTQEDQEVAQPPEPDVRVEEDLSQGLPGIPISCPSGDSSETKESKDVSLECVDA